MRSTCQICITRWRAYRQCIKRRTHRQSQSARTTTKRKRGERERCMSMVDVQHIPSGILHSVDAQCQCICPKNGAFQIQKFHCAHFPYINAEKPFEMFEMVRQSIIIILYILLLSQVVWCCAVENFPSENHFAIMSRSYFFVCLSVLIPNKMRCSFCRRFEDTNGHAVRRTWTRGG